MVKLGYVVLCPDALCLERQDPEKKLKDGAWERFEFLRLVVDGRCMAWKNILDMRRAIDYLASRPEVKSDRLGCYGHSMGSTHLAGGSVGTAAEMPCGKLLPADIRGDPATTKLLHCFPNFIPGLHQFGDTPDI